MSNELPIPTILQIQKICTYLSGNDRANSNAFSSGFLDERLQNMIYAEGLCIQNIFNLNPAYSGMRNGANYLYALLGKYAVQAQTILNNLAVAPPLISGPQNQTVNVGGNAAFTVAVTSAVPYTLQWYDSNGNPIAGAVNLTYIFPNAQLTDSGKTFFAKATNVAGTVTSVTAVLVVNAALIGYYYYGDVDYATALLANTDPVPYVGTFPITNGQPLSILLPSAAANKYMVFKYPVSQSVKTNYTNLPINVGVIPSIAWNQVVTFGGWHYIFTRQGNTFGLNSVNPLIFS